MTTNRGMVLAGVLVGGWIGLLLVIAAATMTGSWLAIAVTLGLAAATGICFGRWSGLAAGLVLGTFGLLIACGISEFLIMRLSVVVLCMVAGGWRNALQPARTNEPRSEVVPPCSTRETAPPPVQQLVLFDPHEHRVHKVLTEPRDLVAFH